MRSRTHIASANALCLLCLNPTTPKELIITMSAATVGGIICDLDVRTSEVHKLVDTVTSIIFLLLFGLYVYDYKYNAGIYTTLKHGVFYKPILGFILFLILILYGSHKPHRSFMHSIFGCILFTGISYLFFGKVWLPFLIGFISHIVLDFLNKKGVRIFYPVKQGYCLSLCDSDGLTDKILFVLSILIVVVKLFLM